MQPTFLAIIPARGGSKGVRKKNIKDLAGKPLIAWTIEAAKKSKYISKLILSSDNQEIIDVAKQYNCEVPFKRPKELAQDDTPSIATVIHAIEQCPGYDYVVLLQPTSPLRRVEDIDGCIEYILKKNGDFCVSVMEPDKSPYWMYTIDNNGFIVPLIKQEKPFLRRQELPSVFVLNGAIYIAKTNSIIKENALLTSDTLTYVMEKEYSMDIDTELDFTICEALLRRNN